jgi:hypothetical protein
MKQTALVLTLILALLLSAVAGMHFVDLGRANPYNGHEEGFMWIKDGEVPAPEGTELPQILFFSPKNNESYASNNISLSFNVSAPKNYMWCSIDYKPSWQASSTHINNTHVDYVNINLTGIPEGSHYIEVTAVWKYVFENHLDTIQRWITHYTSYNISGCATVYFTIDLSPKISITSIMNKTYSSSIIPLDFTVNEPIVKVTYSLDGKENETINGNTTLPELSNGLHSISVYVWDVAGDVWSSETVYFNVEAFPTVIAAVALCTSVAVTCLGILMYLRKNKH